MIPFLTYALLALSEPLSEDEFLSLALAHGWKQRPNSRNVGMEGISIVRDVGMKKPECLTYWPDSDNKKVSTYLPDHPKDGAGQMFKTPTRDELIRMITEKTAPGKGLRTHTSTGYRRRKDDPTRKK